MHRLSLPASTRFEDVPENVYATCAPLHTQTFSGCPRQSFYPICKQFHQRTALKLTRVIETHTQTLSCTNQARLEAPVLRTQGSGFG